MKRLLAYLFIVLGLGLTFNVSASAESGYCIDGLTSSFYRHSDGKKHFLKGSYWVKKIKNRKNDLLVEIILVLQFKSRELFNRYFSLLSLKVTLLR